MCIFRADVRCDLTFGPSLLMESGFCFALRTKGQRSSGEIIYLDTDDVTVRYSLRGEGQRSIRRDERGTGTGFSLRTQNNQLFTQSIPTPVRQYLIQLSHTCPTVSHTTVSHLSHSISYNCLTPVHLYLIQLSHTSTLYNCLTPVPQYLIQLSHTCPPVNGKWFCIYTALF